MKQTLLALVSIILGVALTVASFHYMRHVGALEVGASLALVGFGFWLLDAPALDAYAAKARTFLPGKDA